MHPFFYNDYFAETIYRQALRLIEIEKLDLYGVDYIFETVIDIIQNNNERKQLYAYITDSMKNLTEIVCAIGGCKDVDIPRYMDIVEESHETPEDKEEARAEAEKQAQRAIDEFNRQCELIARERMQKAEREAVNDGTGCI